MNIDSSTKVVKANVVKIRLLFFVAKYAYELNIVRNVPKIIAEMCIRSCSSNSKLKTVPKKNGLRADMVVIMPITVIRYTLFSRIVGLYNQPIIQYSNKNKMVWLLN